MDYCRGSMGLVLEWIGNDCVKVGVVAVFGNLVMLIGLVGVLWGTYGFCTLIYVYMARLELKCYIEVVDFWFKNITTVNKRNAYLMKIFLKNRYLLSIMDS